MKRQELVASATEVRILLSMLAKMARQEWQEHLDACGVGMSVLHIAVLRLLKHHPYTIKELSAHVLVEPASLVPVVDELERKEYVRRTTDPLDRRRTPLVLTEAGEEKLTSLPVLPASSALVKTLAEMGDQKVTSLLDTLRELASGMTGSQERVSVLTRAVELQTTHLPASAKKVKREKSTVA
jgi:DNA-binding MarR family transcriptional regulator